MREAMTRHLRDDDSLVAMIFGHSSAKADASSEQSLFFGKSEKHHLVVTERRLYLVEFEGSFPAGKDASMEPAKVVATRTRLLDEKIQFPTTARHFEIPGALISTIEINEWIFHPATIGYIFSD